MPSQLNTVSSFLAEIEFSIFIMFMPARHCFRFYTFLSKVCVIFKLGKTIIIESFDLRNVQQTLVPSD